ncbi:MAG: Uncharacterised protein [Flavobacteriia bacterium]|nr:MAG: Uncharacterised protein [Flavobacteriia bacterium]
MVVALDLERTGKTLSNIHQASIFLARLDEHVRPVLGQRLQPDDGVLVGTVFAPHARVDGQFSEVGLSAQNFRYLGKFILGEPEFSGYFRIDRFLIDLITHK